MKTLYQHQRDNVRKTWTLVLVFLLVVIGIGWFFSYYYGNPYILYIAVAFAFIMNAVSYWKSDKIVIKMSGAKLADEEKYREINNILENLSISQGMQKPKLYVIKDPAPNAFATGRNEEHGVVAVTTGLLGMLEKNELEGVLAHELAHIKNKDILIGTMVVVLVGFIAILSDILIRSMIFGRGGGDRDNGNAGIVLAVIGIALAILSPLIAKLIHLSISRKREFNADATGALMTRYPEGLAAALKKIESYSKEGGMPLKKTNKAMAHMYIANPFGSKAKKGWNKLWSSHPQTEDRVKALMSGQK
jgi:heat shock protein HtpX